jgi:WD40 repeat protein
MPGGHSGLVIDFSIFGDYLFSASYDSTTIMWNLTTAEIVHVFKGKVIA